MRNIKAIRDRSQVPRPIVSGEELQLLSDIQDLLDEVDELNAQIRLLQSSQKSAPYQAGI